MLLKEKLEQIEIILGSRSPRRRELLTGLGIRYRMGEDYDCKEIFPTDMPVGQVAEYLASTKSASYPEQLTERQILITADTVVICDGEVLGKPESRDDALRILRKLSGNVHCVITGVVLRGNDVRRSFSAETKVWFRTLTDTELEHYVDRCKPYDKAGAYGIQEWIGYAAIERIEGSYYNVMGLPTQMLYRALEEFPIG